MKGQASIDALNEGIRLRKIRCFDLMRDVARLTPEQLGHAGYRGKTNDEAVLLVLEEEAKSIERAIQVWERQNPDG